MTAKEMELPSVPYGQCMCCGHIMPYVVWWCPPGPKGDTGAASTVPGPAGTNGTDGKGTTCVVTGSPGLLHTMTCTTTAGLTTATTWMDGQNGVQGTPGAKGDTGVGIQGPVGPASTVQGPQGPQGPAGSCSCPWACSNVCVPASAHLDARSSLWAKCSVTLGTNPGILNYVIDGTPQVYSHACGRPCTPETITIDKGSTYCFMSLPDPA